MGCIYNLLSIVDIRNCTFTNNSAFSLSIQKYTEALGDAIYLSNSNGSISTCVFQNNGVYSQKSNINDISNLKKMYSIGVLFIFMILNLHSKIVNLLIIQILHMVIM